jgi:thiol-disulfide isomerase/thioredoxin
MHRIRILAAIAFALNFTDVYAADPKPLEIGKPAPNFELPGVDGKTYRLDDFRDAKLLVVVFTCNHCPTAQAYDDRIVQLDRDFKNRGVALVAISPNDPRALRLDELGYTEFSDSFEEMNLRAKDRDYKFPYLYDGETQNISREFGVLATPHVFIFDSGRKLRYQGRIDNSDIHEVTSHEARDAIEALLAGKSVPVETTKVFGCSTKWADKQSTAVESLKKWDAEPVTLETIDLAGVQKLAKNALSDDASQADSGKLLLVNLWATWCGPCVQEMPELVTMNRMYRKRPFEFITISLDEDSAKAQALKTLQEVHASGKNYLLTTHDADKLAAALDPQMPGPLPYTLLIAPGGKIVYRHSGPIEPVEVKRAIVDYIGRTYAGRKDK